MDRRDWYLVEENSIAFINLVKGLFPGKEERIESLFPEGGSHYRLAANSQNRCVIANPAGCSLPEEIRPLYCRLYPAWITGGLIQIADDPECLAIQETANMPEALSLVGLNATKIKRLFAGLRSLWNLD